MVAAVQEEYAAGRELVVKASGLAAGKGVLMPQSMNEAKEAVKEVMVSWFPKHTFFQKNTVKKV